MDWKLLFIIYLVTAGFWGFLLKVTLSNLDWKTVMVYGWMAVAISFIPLFLKDVQVGLTRYHGLAMVIGILGCVSAIALYKLLSLRQASCIIPLTSPYVLITVLLSSIFLKEPITAKTLLGAALSIVSVVLLTL
jgi:bacterial/archaeal transporter family protein